MQDECSERRREIINSEKKSAGSSVSFFFVNALGRQGGMKGCRTNRPLLSRWPFVALPSLFPRASRLRRFITCATRELAPHDQTDTARRFTGLWFYTRSCPKPPAAKERMKFTSTNLQLKEQCKRASKGSKRGHALHADPHSELEGANRGRGVWEGGLPFVFRQLYRTLFEIGPSTNSFRSKAQSESLAKKDCPYEMTNNIETM